MKAKPTLSVIVPAYNAAEHIVRCLESVLSQSVKDCEIIVVDDGSSDGTSEIVAEFSSSSIRLIRFVENQGVAAARNAGIREAKGKYIAFLDSDDEWLPSKVQKQVVMIEKNPLVTLVTCRADLIDENGINLGDVYKGAAPAEGEDAWRILLSRASAVTSSVITTRDALNRVGLFDESLPVAEDQDVWIKLALQGPVAHVPEVLVRKHEIPMSLSNQNYRRQADILISILKSHIEKNRSRLGAQAVREILGKRYGQYGRLTFRNGHPVYGATMIMGAMMQGDMPLKNLMFLIKNNFAGRWLKRLLTGLADKHKSES